MLPFGDKNEKRPSCDDRLSMVGAEGFEPPTPSV
jgi:hypothetical protein